MTDILLFSVYIILLLYLGWKAKLKDPSRDEYLLSNRRLTVPALVATLVTTWYGGILGIGEFIYLNGISAWIVFGVPYYIFAALFAFFLAPKIRAQKYISIPDLLEKHYGKTASVIGSFFVMFITSPAPYILITGILISYMLGLSFTLSILLATVFSVVYIFKGGFQSVVQTDKFQFILMFSGFLLLFTFLFFEYGSPVIQFEKLPETHKNLTGGLSLQSIFVWFLIASWTFIDPGFHQRTAAAKSPETARKGILISIIFWFVFDMLTLWTGIYASIALNNADPLMLYPKIAEQVLPSILKSFFMIALLATAMSTTDSFSFISAQTFGQDIIASLNNKKSDAEVTHYTQIGLFLTMVSALFLIWVLPSVVKMWYTLGSLFIPPILIPIVSALFRPKSIKEREVILLMMASFFFTFGWFIDGIFHDGSYLFGVEPFLPGLCVSILIYFFSTRFIRSARH